MTISATQSTHELYQSPSSANVVNVSPRNNQVNARLMSLANLGASAAMNAVVTNPDLLSLILSAVEEGKAEEACALAVRWRAARKGPPCDDDVFWRRLLTRVFPYTVGHEKPRSSMTNKAWFDLLYNRLSEAISGVRAAQAYMEFGQSMKARNLLRHFDSSRMDDLHNGPLFLSIAKLELKVVRWGRFRPMLRYIDTEVLSYRSRVLTDNEMRARLDQLDAQDTTFGWRQDQVGPPLAP